MLKWKDCRFRKRNLGLNPALSLSKCFTLSVVFLSFCSVTWRGLDLLAGWCIRAEVHQVLDTEQ